MNKLILGMLLAVGTFSVSAKELTFEITNESSLPIWVGIEYTDTRETYKEDGKAVFKIGSHEKLALSPSISQALGIVIWTGEAPSEFNVHDIKHGRFFNVGPKAHYGMPAHKSVYVTWNGNRLAPDTGASSTDATVPNVTEHDLPEMVG